MLRAATLLLALAIPSGVHAVTKAKPANGAIAYHRDSGSFGYAVDQPSSRAARIEALRQCGHPRCEVVLRFNGDCGAVANGPKRHVASKGTTREEAETKALRACGQGCELVGWACTR